MINFTFHKLYASRGGKASTFNFNNLLYKFMLSLKTCVCFSEWGPRTSMYAVMVSFNLRAAMKNISIVRFNCKVVLWLVYKW